jgi:hypothetical protein
MVIFLVIANSVINKVVGNSFLGLISSLATMVLVYVFVCMVAPLAVFQEPSPSAAKSRRIVLFIVIAMLVGLCGYQLIVLGGHGA